MSPLGRATARESRLPEESRFFKGLIHAPAGNGKTTFIATAQEDERTFPMAFLNWDSGEDSLVGLGIDVFDIHEPQDFDDIYSALRAGTLESKVAPGEPFRSVGVDSITETQINSLFHILGKDRDRADPDLLAQQDWGVVLVQMRRMVRKFMKALQMHTFMTALSKETVIKGIGPAKWPSVQGSFFDELPGVPNVVAYLANEDVVPDEEHPLGVQRTLLLHSNPKFGVKCRTPWGQTVPAEIIDPTVSKLLDTLGFTS